MKVAAGRAARGGAVTVEIVVHAPTEFFHCLHCELVWRESGFGRKIHAEQRESSLPEDLADEYATIARRVREMQERYGDRVRFRVIDVLSLEGFFKCLIHLLGRFPAFIVAGHFVGNTIEDVINAVTARQEAEALSTELEGRKA